MTLALPLLPWQLKVRHFPLQRLYPCFITRYHHSFTKVHNLADKREFHTHSRVSNGWLRCYCLLQKFCATLLGFSFSDTSNTLSPIIQCHPPIRYLHFEQQSPRHKTDTRLHPILVWITMMASTKPGNPEAHDRAALNSTKALNTEKSLLWWCQLTIHIQIFINLANRQSQLEEVTFSGRLCFFASLLFLGGWFQTSTMITMAQLGVNVRKLNSNLCAALVTPGSTRGKNMNRKGMVEVSQNLSLSPPFSYPMSLHAIAQLRDLKSKEDEEGNLETANQQRLQLGVEDQSDLDSDHNDEVKLEEESQFTAEVLCAESKSNLLLPVKYVILFIRENFYCNLCSYRVKDASLKTVKVGFACSLFWKCSNPACDNKSDNIIAKRARTDLSRSYRRYHPDLPAFLGDYTINRQIVLECQLSGGVARMASTFGGLTLLSRQSIWLDNFSKVEQMIGKAQIRLGKKLLIRTYNRRFPLVRWNLN
jgi:hypothetical protein